MVRNVFFKTLVYAFVIGMAISSCVEVHDLYDPEYAAKLAEYRDKWVEQYGELNPDEDWGFDDEESFEDTVLVSRATIKETHEWEQLGLIPPATITPEEIQKVNDYLADTANVDTVSFLNLSDFWAQQVYSSNDGFSYLNQLKVVNSTGTADHVLDGNSGETKTVYIQSGGTSGFFCYSSFSGKKIDDYIIIQIDGAYYMCMELYDRKESTGEQIGGDGIHNDWIIKLTPVTFTNTKRIICEDLGLIGDFDFNDIVFDVSDGGWRWNGVNNVHEAIITVHAAGGTLPVFIGGVDVHKALGVEDHVMVNTGAVGGMDNVPPATFRIPWPASNNLRDIEVLVKTNEALCALTAPVGDAPQKICVPTNVGWTRERQNIKTLYPDFPNVGWEETVSEGGDVPSEEPETPEEPESPEDPETPNESITEYGVMIAAEDLVSGQTIPAKYFEHVGDECTVTIVGKFVQMCLRTADWQKYENVQTNDTEVTTITLSGVLLEKAKNGELCYDSYNAIPTIYIK